MEFSENWLRSFVDPPVSRDELARLLTMAGLEVEAMRPVAPRFSGVVVAQVTAVERHPDADKLKLCRVDTGAPESLQIVCGAPNVAVGMRVPCALVGAVLPGMVIKRVKVRGVESTGMLCSARELGLSQDHAGLLVLSGDAPVGLDIREHLLLDDFVITLKLTPNRADCLSVYGIAREVAALTGAPLSYPKITAVVASHERVRDVVLDAPEACPRYCGRVISGVDARAPTPAWMKSRLERCGIRAISILVDVTNYVMLELGQPLHAFDNAQLEGMIHVRYPRAGEKLLLLNEQRVTPSGDTALIADEADLDRGGRALALAGIMGGVESGISDATTELFLESAFFLPQAIAGKARALGFGSDASHRYERGVDFELQRPAIERATRLILETCGGTAGPVIEALSEAALPRRNPVRLRVARAAKVLGIALSDADIESVFARLGFAFVRDDGVFTVTPPSHRFDIEIEEDLIEEVARLYGYDNIPPVAPKGGLSLLPLSEERRSANELRHLIAERDYQEVVNFSFVDAAWEADFCANSAPIVLANPISSQTAVMRSSLIGSLVGTLAFNLNRRANRVRVFEIGRCFARSDSAGEVAGYRQPLRLGALCAGPAQPLQWGEKTRNADFYDAKCDLEALFPTETLRFEALVHPALHPGRAATVLRDGNAIGIIGELHPSWVQKYELAGSDKLVPVLFEIDLAALTTVPVPHYREVSRYPTAVRDLALVLPFAQSFASLLEHLREAAPAIVRDILLFDVYDGKGVAAGQKSLALRIVMQDTEKTLADADADAAISALIHAAELKFGASVRK